MALTKVKAGNILLTTPSASSNDVTPATTQYVTTALANMVDSAPSTLNTLNELAAALGDDANFSTTVTNSIATKLPLAGGTMTGTIAGFTSTGIDDNATSTAITIDSAETIFHKTTSPTLHSAVTGIVFENGSLLNDVTRGDGKSITLAQNLAVDSGNTWAYLAAGEGSYYQQFNGNHYFGTRCFR